MIVVMRKRSANLRTSAKEASHERIVQAAARAIRRSGYSGTGVADTVIRAPAATGVVGGDAWMGAQAASASSPAASPACASITPPLSALP